MGRSRLLIVVAVVLTHVFLRAPVAAGQAGTAAIAGAVTDTTGSALPGVTIEVRSPALIEQVRTAVTDGQGAYRILALPPGVYSVTFTLADFRTYRREGIELRTGFTAPADAVLEVGAVQETVTVTGASPVVDVQNTQTDNVISRETLQILPTNQNLQGFATLTPGVTEDGFDVGGNRHERAELKMAGRPPQRLLYDGVTINSLANDGDGKFGSYAVNVPAMQEVALGLGTMSAEYKDGGINVNHIPREGSNSFAGLVDLGYGNGAMQWSNLNDEFRNRQVRFAAEARKTWDYAANYGGPIARNRLWFFGAARWWGGQENQPANFYNKLQNAYIGAPFSGVRNYEADVSRRAFTDFHFSDVTGRLTWQVAKNHKISWGHSFQKSCICDLQVTGAVAPEATTRFVYDPMHLSHVNYTNPASTRLLIEAGFGYFHDSNLGRPGEGTGPLDISILELVGTPTVSANYRYNASGRGALPSFDYYGHSIFDQYQGRASMSYVTGTNSLKGGVQLLMAVEDRQTTYGKDAAFPGDVPVSYNFARGLPVSLEQIASPHLSLTNYRDLGLYIQDQLTLHRLTLNGGLRFDNFWASIPAQTRPAGPFVGAISFAAIGSDALPSFHSVVPRFGAAYDLFGNAKTAIKASIGKYVNSVGSNLITPYHPALRISTVATRSWSDNGNFVPDCDLTNAAANGECGALDNRLFGQSTPATATDPALLDKGRGYNWQTTLAVQQEIRQGWGVEVAYDRTWYGDFRVTDNLAVTPADYDPFCVTAPSNPRLPNGGGYQICGLYDINPAKFGAVNNLVTLHEKFGERSQVFNGMRISTDGRFARGAFIGGGLSFGRTWDKNCAIVDSPQGNVGAVPPVPGRLYCDSGPPLSKTIQFKLYSTYSLPYGIDTSATFRVLEGAVIDANLSYSNAQIAPSLGRDLASCGRLTGAACTQRVTVPLYAPGDTLFEPRVVVLDWRLSKVVSVGHMRLRGLVDFYNLLNTNAALLVSGTYDSTWPRPTSTPPGRTVRIGAKVDW
jgi:hypothetical protein